MGIIPQIRHDSPSVSCSLGNQKWIFSIATQALPVCEELPKVQCRHLASGEEPCPCYSSGANPIRVVDVSEDRGNCFHSVPDLAIELVFLALHLFLELCPILLLLGNHHNGCPFVKLCLALIPMRTVLALIEEEAYPAHAALLDVGASFGLISRRAGDYSGSVLIELKISENWINVFSGKIGGNQVNILFIRQFLVLCSAVGTVGDHGHSVFLLFHLIQMVLQQCTVAGIVLLHCLICHNRAVAANRFFEIGDISAMLLSGFLPECCLRI